MADYPERRVSETARAYEAAQAYFALLADRSIDAVSQKLAKSIPLLKKWSAQHNWVERARAYDQALSKEAARAASVAYLADLELHRQKSIDAGQRLFDIAGQLLARINEQLNREPQVLFDQQGHQVEIAAMDVPVTMLMTIAKAYCISLDLEAWAMGVQTLAEQIEQP